MVVLITVCDSNYAEHFGTSCCLHFRVMESGLRKQFQSLITSHDFIEVVFVWSSFPLSNKLFNFKFVLPYPALYDLHSLITTRVNRLAYKDMTRDISTSKTLSEY